MIDLIVYLYFLSFIEMKPINHTKKENKCFQVKLADCVSFDHIN